MFTTPSELAERERPFRVGVIGAGQFGTKCLAQLERVDGLHAPALDVEEIPERLRPQASGGCLTEAGVVEGAVSPADERREFVRRKNGADAHVSTDGDHVPFALPDGAELVRPVDEGASIQYDDVAIEDTFVPINAV